MFLSILSVCAFITKVIKVCMRVCMNWKDVVTSSTFILNTVLCTVQKHIFFTFHYILTEDDNLRQQQNYHYKYYSILPRHHQQLLELSHCMCFSVCGYMCIYVCMFIGLCMTEFGVFRQSAQSIDVQHINKDPVMYVNAKCCSPICDLHGSQHGLVRLVTESYTTIGISIWTCVLNSFVTQ